MIAKENLRGNAILKNPQVQYGLKELSDCYESMLKRLESESLGKCAAVLGRRNLCE